MNIRCPRCLRFIDATDALPVHDDGDCPPSECSGSRTPTRDALLHWLRRSERSCIESMARRGAIVQRLQERLASADASDDMTVLALESQIRSAQKSLSISEGGLREIRREIAALTGETQNAPAEAGASSSQ